ncbi:MAG: hypothetical protein ACPGUD_04960 [Parashewanella sp.]
MKFYLKGYLVISLMTLIAIPNVIANTNVDQAGLNIHLKKMLNNFTAVETVNSGAEWCKQNKLTSNCFPLNNQLNNTIHVSITEFHNEIDFPAKTILRFADVATPPKIKSCNVTITDNQTKGILYQGNFDDMVGLICKDGECKAWY